MLDPKIRAISATARQNYDDTWSPAVQQSGGVLHYWPNITCADRQTAIDRASWSVTNLQRPEDMLQWNVWPDTLAGNE